MAAGYAKATMEISDSEQALIDFRAALASANAELKTTSAMTRSVRQWRDLYKAYKDTAAAGGDVTGILKDMTPLAKKVSSSFDGSKEAVEDMNAAFDRMASDIPAQVAELEATIAELEQELWALDAAGDVQAVMGGDASALIAAIEAAKAELAALLELAAAAGIDLESTGGSGGGGSGGSRASAYEKAIEKLEHLKKLEQLTYEQELSNLETLSEKYRLSAEERMELEERIYALKKQIAERDADNLTDLSNAMIDALGERYDAMRDAELEALDQSRDAWEEWRDHNVSAIQDQIDALDALDQAEDRQQTRDEHLRKIAQLEQSLAYEQDSYNQIQLQKQLDAAKSAYEEWLKDIEREDQRTALQDAIDSINAKADTEISALDTQQDQIEAYYDERMKQANLQAEAELELTRSTQQQIIDLLAEYAPEYDAAGRTLGERLMDGFTSAVGVFDTWFDDFSAKLAAAVDSMQAANVSAAATRAQTYDENGNPASGVVLNQENNFYTPVETPAETARRIQRANEDLADQLLGE